MFLIHSSVAIWTWEFWEYRPVLSFQKFFFLQGSILGEEVSSLFYYFLHFSEELAFFLTSPFHILLEKVSLAHFVFKQVAIDI